MRLELPNLWKPWSSPTNFHQSFLLRPTPSNTVRVFFPPPIIFLLNSLPHTLIDIWRCKSTVESIVFPFPLFSLACAFYLAMPHPQIWTKEIDQLQYTSLIDKPWRFNLPILPELLEGVDGSMANNTVGVLLICPGSFKYRPVKWIIWCHWPALRVMHPISLYSYLWPPPTLLYSQGEESHKKLPLFYGWKWAEEREIEREIKKNLHISLYWTCCIRNRIWQGLALFPTFYFGKHFFIL